VDASPGPVAAALANYGFACTDEQVAAALRAVLERPSSEPWAVGIDDGAGRFTVHLRGVTESQAREAAAALGTERAGVAVRHLPSMTGGELADAFGQLGEQFERWRNVTGRRPAS